MKSSFIKAVYVLFLLVIIAQLCGCGETLQGIGKDARRVGKGVKTIFIRDNE